MANETVNRQVNIFIQSGEAQKAYDTLIKKQQQLNAELAKTADPKKIAQLNTELNKLSEPIDRATKKLKGDLLPTFKDLQTATNKWLNEFKRTGDPAALANFQKFNAALQEQKNVINGLQQSHAQLSKSSIFSGAFWGTLAGNVIAKATSVIKDFFSDVIEEATQAEIKNTKFKNSLDTIGKADAFDRLASAADKLRDSFKFLDNDDILDVFRKLVDFGKLTEQQMRQLVPVIINFASKTGQSLEEASNQIIQAIAGGKTSGELKRFGLNLKDAKDEASRLGVIMTELKPKVEGAGEAFAKTSAGGIASAKQEFKELKEEIGTGLLPILNSVLSFLSRAAQGAVQFATDMKNFFIETFGGIDGMVHRAERLAAASDAIDKKIGLDKADKFIGSSKDEIDAEIKRVEDLIVGFQKVIALKERALKEGFANENDADELKAKRMGLLQMQTELESLKALASKTTLGISTETDEASAKTKKLVDDLQELLKELQKIDEELQLVNVSDVQRDLIKLEQKYDALRVRAKGNSKALLEIERLYQIERGNIIDKYAKEAAAKAAKLDEEQKKRIGEIAAHANDALSKALADNTERDKLNADNNLITNFFKSNRQKRKEDLDAQQQQELDALDDLLQHKVISQDQYEQDVTKIHQHYNTLRAAQDIDAVAQAAQQALDIFSSITQAQADNENQELENDRKRNDAKKTNLERRLKSGLVTQLQYNREVARLDLEQQQKEKEVRRKQFERDKITSIIQTTINIAESISKALAAAPPPANFILAAIVGAAGAIQLAKIEKQKAPEFAKGGKLGGRSHADGGNAVVDGHGRKIAEVEAGEGIVNKKTMADRNQYTVSGTPNQIISKLNSLYGIHWAPGARLQPVWKTMKVPSINYDLIKRSYALGGQFNAGSNSSQAITDNNQMQNDSNIVIKDLTNTLAAMKGTIADMQRTLSKGIVAYTLLSDQEKQQDRMNAIRDDATLK
jgi:hypothetical protein